LTVFARLYHAPGIGYVFRWAAALLLLPQRFAAVHVQLQQLQQRVSALDMEPPSGARVSAQEVVGCLDNPAAGRSKTTEADKVGAAHSELKQHLAFANAPVVRSIVEQVFQGVLGRAPGPLGLENYPKRLMGEPGFELADFIAELIARPEFQKQFSSREPEPVPQLVAPPTAPAGAISPDLVQLAQDLVTERLVSAGARLHLPPGQPADGPHMEERLRALLRTLAMLGPAGATPDGSSARRNPVAEASAKVAPAR
jgi:hypothetical protein